jgi:L-lactate utilization protein LutC
MRRWNEYAKAHTKADDVVEEVKDLSMSGRLGDTRERVQETLERVLRLIETTASNRSHVSPTSTDKSLERSTVVQKTCHFRMRKAPRTNQLSENIIFGFKI